MELAGCEGFENLSMLAMQSGEPSRSQTLRDLSLQPDVVDQGLQPAQHLVATHATQRGLERQVEARLLDVVGELALALVQRTAKQAKVGGSAPLERSLEHLELDGDSCGQDLPQQLSVKCQPAHQLSYGHAMAGGLDIGTGALLGGHPPQAFQDFDRLADKWAAHLERGGQLAVAGEPVARLQVIAVDVLVDPVQDLAEDVHSLDGHQMALAHRHRLRPPPR